MDLRHYNHELLQRTRQEQGKSAADIAKALGVHKNTISRAETGVIASYELLCQIAKELNVNVTDFLYPQPLQEVA